MFIEMMSDKLGKNSWSLIQIL